MKWSYAKNKRGNKRKGQKKRHKQTKKFVKKMLIFIWLLKIYEKGRSESVKVNKSIENV